MVDVVDSKSTASDGVPVRVRSPAPINPTVNDTFTVGFIISFGSGLEPIAVELSGGQFLPPVQTLVATSIFSRREKMQIESGHRVRITTSPQQDTGPT